MTFDEFDYRRRYRKHPLLSQFSSSLPSDIKELFQWMEFIVANNAIASAGLKKLSETPITTFRYMAGDDQAEGSLVDENSWKTLIEKNLRMRSELINISYNLQLYGNVFVSVHAPFIRFLSCAHCGKRQKMQDAHKLKTFVIKGRSGESFDNEPEQSEKKSNDYSKLYEKKTKKRIGNLRFSCYCGHCAKITPHAVIDEKTKDKDGINVVTWDPNKIKLTGNPISGEEEIYYEIPDDLRSAVTESDKFILSAMPLQMIEASLTNKLFKFAKGSVYHAKREVISGLSTSWGMPALSSAIPPFLTLMILRKANEKIATDYMVPLRVLYPSQQSNPSEMYNYMSGTDFVGKIRTMIDTWKADPSGVQTSPFPLGVETILGDGKLLTLGNEIDQLESNVANSLGIPIEFIKGGLSYSSQGSSLRLLENQMAKTTAGLEDILSFVVEKVSVILDKKPIGVKLVPFKIIDDLQEKAAIIQLATSGSGIISKSTMLELFNMDSQNELQRSKDEQKEDIKASIELQDYQQEVASNIEERAKQQAQMNNGTFEQLNQQSLMQEAQSYADRLSQMDEGSRRSELDTMSKNNYIMYGVVKSLLEMNDRKEDYAAAKASRQEQ